MRINDFVVGGPGSWLQVEEGIGGRCRTMRIWLGLSCRRESKRGLAAELQINDFVVGGPRSRLQVEEGIGRWLSLGPKSRLWLCSWVQAVQRP